MANSADIKLQAITIGFVNYREYDRVLTLFSPERGVFTATAHAARRAKSEIRACADMFFYGDFVLKENAKGYLSVKAADMIDIFYDLRLDINRLSCATYMCDFVKATAISELEEGEYFLLLLRCLSSLCYDKVDYRAVKLKFEIEAMKILGYEAEFEICSSCGKKMDGFAWFVDGAGGAVCGRCNPERHGIEISLRGLATLKQIDNMPIERLRTIKIGDDVFKEVNACFKKYLFWHLERTFKSAKFLEKNYNYVT